MNHFLLCSILTGLVVGSFAAGLHVKQIEWDNQNRRIAQVPRPSDFDVGFGLGFSQGEMKGARHAFKGEIFLMTTVDQVSWRSIRVDLNRLPEPISVRGLSFVMVGMR